MQLKVFIDSLSAPENRSAQTVYNYENCFTSMIQHVGTATFLFISRHAVTHKTAISEAA